MKITAAIVALAGILSAAHAEEEASSKGNYIALTAAHSDSAIHLQSIHAAGQKLWIGKATSAYCPKNVKKQGGCPKAMKGTNFAFNNGGLSMGTVVPGGQAVYIDYKTGEVQYTVAHSGAMPENAITSGWKLDNSDAKKMGYGTLTWKDDNSQAAGLMACEAKGDKNKGAYNVFAAVKGVNFGKDCLKFEALTHNETKPDAWQYQ